MHLYMIRHGQSYVNLPDWSGTNWDQPLTELGRQQAAALAAWLPQHLPEVNILYASTMLRARETALACKLVRALQGAAPKTVPDVRQGLPTPQAA